MKIVLLGSGNVATHLGQAFKKAGHHILQIWSRNQVNAKKLANKLGVEVAPQLSIVNLYADIYILAVSDDAIREVAEALPIHHQLLVHTSGSTDLTILEGVSSKIGVFYPIQTFSKEKKINFKKIPIAIEGNSPNTLHILSELASGLSEKVIEMNSIQRRTLHIAAIFACNFTNHLYHIANEILQKQHLNFDLLRPLIAETAEKVQKKHPVDMQTGPATRGDQTILNKHQELLKSNPAVLELYQKLSQSIIHSKNNRE